MTDLSDGPHPSASTGLARLALREAAFRRFLVAQALAQTATWLHRVALVWVAVRASGGNGAVVGTMTAMQFAPLAVATVIGGRLGDRFDRRALLVRTQLSVFLIVTVLSVVDRDGFLSIPVALVGAGALGVLAGIDTPVRLAHVPSLVAADAVRSATSINSATFNVAKLVGPALAGVLIASTDTWVVFAATGMLAAFAASLLRQLPAGAGPEPHAERESLLGAARIVRGRLDLRLPLFVGLVFGAAGSNLQVVIPMMATREFGRSAAGFGILTAGLALGSLVGAISSAVRSPKSPTLELLFLMGTMAAMQFVASLAPSFTAFGLLLVGCGAVLLAGNTASVAILQLCAPKQIASRVLGMYVLAYFVWSPVGGPLLGVVADTYGSRAAVIMSALCSTAGLVGAGVLLWRGARSANHVEGALMATSERE